MEEKEKLVAGHKWWSDTRTEDTIKFSIHHETPFELVFKNTTLKKSSRISFFS
jgi:hypothetical protein